MEENILKEGWRESKEMFNNYDTPNVVSEKMDTALERLIKRYRRFSIISAIMMIFIILFFGEGRIPFKPEWRPWITGLFFIEFLAVGITNLFLTYKLGKIDVYRMPVSEIISICRSAKRCHLRFVSLSMTYVFALVILFIYSIEDLSPWFVISICSGALVGLIIGINKLIEFLRDYRNLDA